MKTTIRFQGRQALVVKPGAANSVNVIFYSASETLPDLIVALTPDQAGALIFGIEQALEVNQIAEQREAA